MTSRQPVDKIPEAYRYVALVMDYIFKRDVQGLDFSSNDHPASALKHEEFQAASEVLEFGGLAYWRQTPIGEILVPTKAGIFMLKKAAAEALTTKGNA